MPKKEDKCWKAPQIVGDFKAVKQMALSIPEMHGQMPESDKKKLAALRAQFETLLRKYNCTPVGDTGIMLKMMQEGDWHPTLAPKFEVVLKRQFKECLLPHLDGLLD